MCPTAGLLHADIMKESWYLNLILVNPTLIESYYYSCIILTMELFIVRLL